MPDENKEPTKAVEKPKAKLVPESDLIAIKRKYQDIEKKLRGELAEIKGKFAEAQAELEVTSTDVEDSDEVKRVKSYLVGESKKVQAERAKLEEDLASFKEREKESRVQTLASKYGIDVESIGSEEDPEKKAYEIVAERLTKEKEELQKNVPPVSPESVLEHEAPSIKKVSPKDMPVADFNNLWEAKKKEALSVK